ncbi:MAG: 1-deoxy-D-xylulose-5-phosphate reductoisomerase, partial [Brevundimonas sp.]
MRAARRVSVLGATGSVGVSTLEVMAAIEAAGGEPFEVEVLTGAGNIGR